ncbi:MAG: septum formation protein Maf [Kordiimonadales bacterium]|nr:MAG: septum formation protein Maf [Kordiimonadales bacterium]
MTNIILASASKTRADMLLKAGVSFCTEKPLTDEGALKAALVAEAAPARDIADALADAKARSVSLINPDALIIGADQVLTQGGSLFSKAKNREEAEQTLNVLSAQTHDLYSAAVVYLGGQPLWRTVTKVSLTMRPLSADFITTYLDALGEDAFWSVGCYQIEGLGAQLFTQVKGDYFTVLGLPLLPLLDFLRGYGALKK